MVFSPPRCWRNRESNTNHNPQPQDTTGCLRFQETIQQKLESHNFPGIGTGCRQQFGHQYLRILWVKYILYVNLTCSHAWHLPTMAESVVKCWLKLLAKWSTLENVKSKKLQKKLSYGSTWSPIYIRHYVQGHRLWYVSQAITVTLSAGLHTQYHIDSKIEQY